MVVFGKWMRQNQPLTTRMHLQRWHMMKVVPTAPSRLPVTAVMAVKTSTLLLTAALPMVLLLLLLPLKK